MMSFSPNPIYASVDSYGWKDFICNLDPFPSHILLNYDTWVNLYNFFPLGINIFYTVTTTITVYGSYYRVGRLSVGERGGIKVYASFDMMPVWTIRYAFCLDEPAWEKGISPVGHYCNRCSIHKWDRSHTQEECDVEVARLVIET